MYDNTIPSNLLDAINLCLTSMGEPPVNTTNPDELPPDAVNALGFVQRSNRDVQASGWHFNTEVMTLSPDVDGFIQLPINVAKVDTVGTSKSVDVAQRGQKLYDLRNNTFVFTQPLTVEIVQILDFEDTPLVFRNFAGVRAAVLYQQSILGDPVTDGALQRRMQEAWAQLQRDEANQADSNIFTDNLSTASILYRGGRYLGRRG